MTVPPVPAELSELSDWRLQALVNQIKCSRREDTASTSSTPAFSNWARTFACSPEAIFYPCNEDDVRCLVELAKRKSRKLRPFGAGHSPSDLVCVQEDDWLMQMDALDEVLEVRSVLSFTFQIDADRGELDKPHACPARFSCS
jgi:L-gulonolactone oxidase